MLQARQCDEASVAGNEKEEDDDEEEDMATQNLHMTLYSSRLHVI